MKEWIMSEQAPVKVTREEAAHQVPSHSPLVKATAKIIMALAICLSLYQLYTAGITPLTALVQRSIHLGAILSLTFLLRPAYDGVDKKKLNLWFFVDWLLCLAAIVCVFYICDNLTAIFERQGDWLPMDFWVSLIGTVLVLEACRRVIGGEMAGICLAALIYAYTLGDIILGILACIFLVQINKKVFLKAGIFAALTFGYWVYGYHISEPILFDMFLHKPYSVERIVTTLWLTTEGIFGLPIGVASTFVFVFVLFGAFLEVTGGGNFFINLAYALTGKYSGGPAKTSVIASGFMGSVSGSAVGNVVATGSFTIPMMKKVGYRPHVAGAIEAAASTGGQLMPPIMGAGAFLMAEFTNTSYLTIIKVALVPAILYYITVLMFVHFEAKKYGLVKDNPKRICPGGQGADGRIAFSRPGGNSGLCADEQLFPHVGRFCGGFKHRGPLAWSTFAGDDDPWQAGCKTPGLALPGLRGGRHIQRPWKKARKNAIMVSVACAAAGIIVGMVTLTGMGLKFSSLVLDLSFGIKALAILLIGAASLVLGMGLPVTASYIVLATLAGPPCLDMGVPILITHMIVFWYSQDANVTPPVSLASSPGPGWPGPTPCDRLYLLEAGQGALYHPFGHGL
jgi:TRAP-type uncharacterized transport system fused permease subunit